jgi:hypothetical protein
LKRKRRVLIVWFQWSNTMWKRSNRANDGVLSYCRLVKIAFYSILFLCLLFTQLRILCSLSFWATTHYTKIICSVLCLVSLVLLTPSGRDCCFAKSRNAHDPVVTLWLQSLLQLLRHSKMDSLFGKCILFEDKLPLPLSESVSRRNGRFRLAIYHLSSTKWKCLLLLRSSAYCQYRKYDYSTLNKSLRYWYETLWWAHIT